MTRDGGPPRRHQHAGGQSPPYHSQRYDGALAGEGGEERLDAEEVPDPAIAAVAAAGCAVLCDASVEANHPFHLVRRNIAQPLEDILSRVFTGGTSSVWDLQGCWAVDCVRAMAAPSLPPSVMCDGVSQAVPEDEATFRSVSDTPFLDTCYPPCVAPQELSATPAQTDYTTPPGVCAALLSNDGRKTVVCSPGWDDAHFYIEQHRPLLAAFCLLASWRRRPCLPMSSAHPPLDSCAAAALSVVSLSLHPVEVVFLASQSDAPRAFFSPLTLPTSSLPDSDAPSPQLVSPRSASDSPQHSPHSPPPPSPPPRVGGPRFPLKWSGPKSSGGSALGLARSSSSTVLSPSTSIPPRVPPDAFASPDSDQSLRTAAEPSPPSSPSIKSSPAVTDRKVAAKAPGDGSPKTDKTHPPPKADQAHRIMSATKAHKSPGARHSTDLKTAPKMSDLKLSPKTSDLKAAKAPKTSDLKHSPKTSDLKHSPKTSPKVSDLRASLKGSDLKTSPKVSDLRASLKGSDLKTSPKASDLRFSPKTSGLRASPKVSDLKLSPKMSDLKAAKASPKVSDLKHSPKTSDLKAKARRSDSAPQPATQLGCYVSDLFNDLRRVGFLYMGQHIISLPPFILSSRFETGNMLSAKLHPEGQGMIEVLPMKDMTIEEEGGEEGPFGRMWFHFEVQRMVGCPSEAGTARSLKFCITGLAPNSSLYKAKHGEVHRPVVGTPHGYHHITTAPVAADSTLTFYAPAPSPSCHVAFTFPYSHTTLLQYIRSWARAPRLHTLPTTDLTSPPAPPLTSSTTNTWLEKAGLPQLPPLPQHGSPTVLISVDSLCRSPDGHLVPLLTITGEGPHDAKPYVIITARVHAGEVPASHITHGLLSLLLTPDDPRAQKLRSRFIFKVVPALNPDGVYRGYSRVDGRGVNLNRVYHDPDPLYHTTVWAASRMVTALAPRIVAYLDIHAHARKRSAFVYGNPMENRAARELQMVFCNLMTLRCPLFDSGACNFNESETVRKDKQGLTKGGTGRVALGKKLQMPLALTLEMHYSSGDVVKLTRKGARLKSVAQQYTTEDFHSVGEAILASILDLYRGSDPTREDIPIFGNVERICKCVSLMCAPKLKRATAPLS